jgi:putative membrane protein
MRKSIIKIDSIKIGQFSTALLKTIYMQQKILVIIAVSIVSFCFGQGAISEKDIKFAKAAAEGGLLEVKLGELSQSNAITQEVKSSGKAMIDDHSKANMELKNLAEKKKIAIPSSINAKEEEKYKELASLKGKEFDKKYSKYMVKDHKKDICLFKKEAKKGKDPELKSWASAQVPVLEHHLDMWKDSCKKIK